MAVGGNVTITFNAGGIVCGNSIVAGKILPGTISSNKIELLLNKLNIPKPACNARRGGPSSKVFCEVYKVVPHEIHHGRSPRGWWYSWKEDNGD